MADTPRTRIYLLASIFQDGQAPGSITAQDMRDYIVSQFPSFVALVSGATVTWTVTAPISKATLTLGTNATLVISGAAAGDEGYLEVTQDATGGRTFTLPAGTVVGSTTAINATANKMTAIAWSYNGSAFTFVLAQQS